MRLPADCVIFAVSNFLIFIVMSRFVKIQDRDGKEYLVNQASIVFVEARKDYRVIYFDKPAPYNTILTLYTLDRLEELLQE